MTRTRQTLFPHSSLDFSRATSEKPVLLNGMRVIFDEKVALYPVELEPDGPAAKPVKGPRSGDGNSQNGRR